MNKIIYSFIFSSVIFISAFAAKNSEMQDVETQTDSVLSPQEAQLSQESNTIDATGYSPLQNVIDELHEKMALISLYIQAIKNAKSDGHLFSGTARNYFASVSITWDTNTSKKGILESYLAAAKKIIDRRVQNVKALIEAGTQLEKYIEGKGAQLERYIEELSAEQDKTTAPLDASAQSEVH